MTSVMDGFSECMLDGPLTSLSAVEREHVFCALAGGKPTGEPARLSMAVQAAQPVDEP